MGGNTGEIQIGSERELYKYVNHQAETTKASTRIILVQMYNICKTVNRSSDHSSSESCRYLHLTRGENRVKVVLPEKVCVSCRVKRCLYSSTALIGPRDPLWTRGRC